jgi:hypothetical protein
MMVLNGLTNFIQTQKDSRRRQKLVTYLLTCSEPVSATNYHIIADNIIRNSQWKVFQFLYECYKLSEHSKNGPKT